MGGPEAGGAGGECQPCTVVTGVVTAVGGPGRDPAAESSRGGWRDSEDQADKSMKRGGPDSSRRPGNRGSPSLASDDCHSFSVEKTVERFKLQLSVRQTASRRAVLTGERRGEARRRLRGFKEPSRTAVRGAAVFDGFSPRQNLLTSSRTVRLWVPVFRDHWRCKRTTDLQNARQQEDS